MSTQEPGSGEGVRTDAPSRLRAAGPEPTGTPGAVALAILLYVGVRLVMVAVIAGVLVAVGLPLLIALLAAIIVALPLSLFLFRGLRARLAGEIDIATASRRERRERLRAELRGDADPDDGSPPERPFEG
ncbi:hypothetical protein GCM10023200_57820 [Actinomycetospora chlora]|uniref:DUF4229 domain-containing protein n=1 Tax=Actinomycetospora chlora TaxID=663608 RepID=A0ABP9CN36_9PSEU